MLALVCVLALGCSSSDTTLERRGGPLPEDATEDVDSGPPVSFCEALTVMRVKCQRCHQDPPQNFAPVPFLTYEDTQAPYYDTDRTFSDAMLSVVERGIMPYVSLNDGDDPIMPLVEPLTSAEKATLLGWLRQGALPLGGMDCP